MSKDFGLCRASYRLCAARGPIASWIGLHDDQDSTDSGIWLDNIIGQTVRRIPSTRNLPPMIWDKHVSPKDDRHQHAGNPGGILEHPFASGSSMTGEPYLIRLADGTTVKSEVFLRNKLKTFTGGKPQR